MDHDDKQKGSPDSMFADWMKPVADFWLSAAKTWSAGAADAARSSSSSPAGDFGKMQQGWEELLKIWQRPSLAPGSAQTLETIFKWAAESPETVMKIVRTTWDGYSQLYQIWLKNLGEAGKAYSPEELAPATFKEWSAFYEKEFQPFFKAPQVGLTRLYLERVNRAVDKFNQLEAAVAEFLHLLNIPVQKSVTAIQEKIEEQAKEGKLSENFKDYYNIWIKILESHYMSLFKMPEYIQSLKRTFSAAEESKLARDKVLTDVLGFFPIPTNKDMDELYKEFYALKKTVKEMAKKIKKLESST